MQHHLFFRSGFLHGPRSEMHINMFAYQPLAPLKSGIWHVHPQIQPHFMEKLIGSPMHLPVGQDFEASEGSH